MTLSVIIPVFNGERYISEALMSILRERDSASCNVEMIIIDDGSVDHTQEICIDFTRKYSGIQYIRQENQGVSVARNTGLQHVFAQSAPDDWIGFLDADDLWHKGWASLLSLHLAKDDDILGFGMTVADSDLMSEEIVVPPPQEISLIGGYNTAITENRRLHFGSYLYRSRLLIENTISFIPKVTSGEDLMFKYEAFLTASHLRYSSGSLYVYRQNKFSVTHNFTYNALSYYETFFLAWHGLIDWLEPRKKAADYKKALAFAQQKVNHSCMYAARSYCQWHNGSFADFKRDILLGLLPDKLILPVSFAEDKNMERDYKTLRRHPFGFYTRYYMLGIWIDIKKYIKKILRRI